MTEAESDEIPMFDLRSDDVVQRRLAALRSIVPEAFTEHGLDLDALRRTLGEEVDSGPERFGLTWPGKARAMQVMQQPSIGTLIPRPDESVDWDFTQNVIIEGDNLEVLKLLQKSYYGKVKMIYIDPPYNTGKEFIYPDNFHEGLRDYLRYTGQVDGDGRQVSSNSEANGRYHSNWLSMMYPRLFLARNLLRNDGIIFVSIDDHEVHNLIALMNEIFGEENFLNVFTWINNLKGRQISNYGAASTKEYVVSFARSIEFTSTLFAPSQLLKEWMPAIYKGFDYELKSDDRGPYVLKNELYNSNSAFNEETRPNLVYDIYYNPETGEVKTEPVSSTHVHHGFIKVAPKRNNDGRHRFHAFRWSRPKVEAEAHDLEFINSKSAWRVYTKVRQVGIAAVKDSVMAIHTADGTRDLTATGLPASAFDYPKPVRIPQLFVLSSSEQDDIVLDFFAGSGTTGHAVMAANAEDGGSRRYIMVQLPEPLASDKFDTIADITRERVRRAGNTIMARPAKLDQSRPDIGFRSYRLSRSTFSVWNSSANGTTHDDDLTAAPTLFAENVRADATNADIVTELLLKAGFELTTPLLQMRMGGVDVSSVADGQLLILAEGTPTLATFEEMVSAQPSLIIVLDRCFGHDDELKVNALQTIRSANHSSGCDIALRVV